MHSRRRPSTPTKQPELKHAAVQVAKFDLKPSLVALCRSESDAEGGDSAVETMARLRPLLAGFPYASLTLAGRETPVVVLKLRGEQIPRRDHRRRRRGARPRRPDPGAELPGQPPRRRQTRPDARRDPQRGAPRRRDARRRVALRHDGAGQTGDRAAPWLFAPLASRRSARAPAAR